MSCDLEVTILSNSHCLVSENVHISPTEGIGNSWGWAGGGSQRPKIVRKFMALNWKVQRGGRGVLGKIPSVGEVWIIIKIKWEFAVALPQSGSSSTVPDRIGI